MDDLLLYLAWFLWLGLLVLAWIGVVKVGILVLFLISKEKSSTFYLSVVSHVSMFYMAFILLRYVPSIPNLLKTFYHERMLYFFKCSFWIYLRWSYDFYFSFYHVDWFANMDKFLHFRINLKSHLILVKCNVESSLLTFNWEILHLNSSGILVCSFLLVFLSGSGFGIRVMLAS